MTDLVRIPAAPSIELTDFEGTPLAGASVTVLSEIAMGKLLDLQEAIGAKDAPTVRSALQAFGDDVIVEWNLASAAGTPLPATGEGVLALQPSVALLIFERWSDAVAGAPKDSGGPSMNGSSLQAASVPMEPA